MIDHFNNAIIKLITDFEDILYRINDHKNMIVLMITNSVLFFSVMFLLLLLLLYW